MKNKKLTAFLLAAALAASLSGCGTKQEETGKTTLTLGSWPDETQTEKVKLYNGYKDQLQEKFPDLVIKTDTTNFSDAKIFSMKAVAKLLPTIYTTHFTEVQKTINSGYAGDVTEIMRERGLLDIINPTLLDTLKGSDGQIYAFPQHAYMMGLVINKQLFQKAGLVNADGTVMVPDTYEQLAEYAKQIKDKTGMAGFAICTTNNWGGWHFMNIAWSYGVEFMKQGEDGKWKATFNTPEAVEALQYIKDLKWKYDVLPYDSAIDGTAINKLLGVSQCAMAIGVPTSDLTAQYGLPVEDYAHGKLPAGPKGRYVQMGGGVYMFSPDASKEELNAAFDWLDVKGAAKAALDDTAIANLEKNYKTTLETSGIVLPLSPLFMWSDPERVAKEQEINAKYSNVDPKDFETYMDLTDVQLKSEEPVACQELYGVLDQCIQEVITNESADCKAIIEKANNDFQVNHLDQQ